MSLTESYSHVRVDEQVTFVGAWSLAKLATGQVHKVSLQPVCVAPYVEGVASSAAIYFSCVSHSPCRRPVQSQVPRFLFAWPPGALLVHFLSVCAGTPVFRYFNFRAAHPYFHTFSATAGAKWLMLVRFSGAIAKQPIFLRSSAPSL
jgi:hypothetical protein